jgi:hypothetical protein
VIVDVGAGGGRAGTASARGTDVASRAKGVSLGLGETAFAFAGVGLFLFDFATLSLVLDFFFADLGFGVASGVSVGVADGRAPSCVLLDLDFDLGDGEAALDLRFAASRFDDGLGDSSCVADAEARALRNSARFSFSSSLTCA